MSTSKSTGSPGRKAVKLYSEGADAGRAAAIAAFHKRKTPGGTWQHTLIDRIKPAVIELRGWLVGYICELQTLATAAGRQL